MKRKEMRIVVFITGIVLSFGLLLSTGKAMGVEPGSTADPLVSKSYVDQRVDEVMKLLQIGASSNTGGTQISINQEALKKEILSQVESLIAAVLIEKKQDEKKDTFTYEVVSVKAGQKLIGKQSTEIILRGGKGTVLGSSGGGIQDCTQGVDWAHGAEVPRNHLLLIPRDDGRGILVSHDAVFMVRGDYEIKE